MTGYFEFYELFEVGWQLRCQPTSNNSFQGT